MKILLPVDGSPLALEAVHHAIRLVRDGLKASFVVANVQEPSSLYEMVVLHDPDALQRMAQGAGEDAIASAAERLAEAGIEYETEIATGNPAHTLVDIAERYGCQAIIMGAHGMGEGSAAFGAVAQEVLRSSPTPVMIVRPQQPAASEPGVEETSAGSSG